MNRPLYMNRQQVIRDLSAEYEKHTLAFYQNQNAIGNKIPVGGAHMPDFFRAEGLRVMINNLQANQTAEEARIAGLQAAQQAVIAWNSRREYQVHFWKNTTDHYLNCILKKCLEDSEIPF